MSADGAGYRSGMRAPHKLDTVAEWLALPEERRVELLGGTLVEKAAPSSEHGLAQACLAGALSPEFNRRGGGHGQAGGWWILTEVDVELSPQDVFRPDLVGWRRERMPRLPTGRPVTAQPDWVCEILSSSTRRHDTVVKLRRYHRAGVGHYWLVDPDDRTLTVLRHEADGYKVVLTALGDETVRAEPFEALELQVGVLFGDEPDDQP